MRHTLPDFVLAANHDDFAESADELMGRSKPVMVPNTSDPCWERFVTGDRQLQSSKPTLGLLIQSNKMSYERNQSAANVRQLAEKSQRFFAQFESLFADELAQILK